MRGNIGPITDLALFAKEIREEAVKRIITACGCGSKDGCEGDIGGDYAHRGCTQAECCYRGCIEWVKTVRGE